MIDVTKILAPVYDTEVNAWVFPVAWTPAQRTQWNDAQERLHASRARAEAAATARAEAAASPEIQIAAALAEATKADRERARIEREAADDAAWLAAVETYGEAHVDRVYTESGSIIQKTMSEQDIDKIQARVNRVTTAALEKGDETAALRDSTIAFKEGIVLHGLVHPDRQKFVAIVEEWPGTWREIYVLRDKLNRGRAEALGKDVAP